jgi:hypothetical protein
VRQRRDEEIEAAIQRVTQTPLQVVARLHLQPGVVAVAEVRATRERHGDVASRTRARGTVRSVDRSDAILLTGVLFTFLTTFRAALGDARRGDR